MNTYVHYDNTSLNFSYNEKCFGKMCTIKTQILYSLNFPENRVISEVEWKNMEQPDRPQITLLYFSIAF